MYNATNQQYLRDDQYKTSANLDARIALHARFSTSKEAWHHWLFDRVGLVDGERVLECGCGTGLFWDANRDRIGNFTPTLSLEKRGSRGIRLTLTDLSAGMVEKANSTLDGLGIVDAAMVADVQSLPFEDGAFDVVVANHMLYHVPDVPKAIAEIARVLRRGGRLCAATNGLGHMQGIYEIGESFAPGTIDARSEVHRAFSLENGAEQLAEVLDDISCEVFPDGLIIYDGDAIVDYLESGIVKPGTSTTGWREAIADRIERDGPIVIAKRSGVFVARKK